MLVGFFKNPEECQCCIIKYVDRIWLSETGDAEILRTLVVKVDEDSIEPLREVRLLLPLKYIGKLKIVNETCFMSPREYHFNSPSVSTAKNYEIVRKPPTPIQYNSFGTINHDGIKNIKVFASFDKLSSYRVGDCTVIRLQLPCDLKRGESTEIRLTFQITSLFTKMTSDKHPIQHIEFTYFSPRYIEEVDQLDRKLEIKVKATLGKDKSHFRIGGFDSIVYLPFEFEKVGDFNPPPYKEKIGFYDIQGKKAPKKRLKLIYRLRAFLKREDLAEDTLTGVDQDVVMSGTLKKRYDITEPIISGIGAVNNKIRKSTLIGYIALTLAIISVILTIITIIFKI